MNENKETVIMELQENELTEMISINVICRLCANQNEKLIAIYSEDGVNNDLANKMNMYLPIKVNETDDLPLQCCWQCASTVLAWHDLVITSVEADRRLRSYQFVTEKQLQDVQVNFQTEESCHSSDKHNEFQEKSEEVKEQYLFYDNISEGENSNLGNTLVTDKVESRHSELTTTTLKESRDDSCVCELCFKVFDTKLLLNKHMKNIHNIKLQKYRRKKSEIDATFTCPVCEKCYTRKFDMQKHIRNKHPSHKSEVVPSNRAKNMELLEQCKLLNLGVTCYRCDICGHLFRKPHNFLRHRNIHNNEKSYCCHICGKKFITSGALARHINQHHYGIKNFGCTVCGKKFSAKTARDEHMNIHTNIRPFVCDTCGKSFKQNSSLHIHKMFHTNVFPFSCNVCSKKFRRKRDLKVHHWTHTGEKPHQCKQCSMSFRLGQDLKRHMKIHAEYFCGICGLKFQQERFLKNHSKIHDT